MKGLDSWLDPPYTSQTCSGCGHVSKNNRKSQSKFVCENCGLTIHADHNAAINIHTLGQRGINAFRAGGSLKFKDTSIYGTWLEVVYRGNIYQKKE
jgi:transposase